MDNLDSSRFFKLYIDHRYCLFNTLKHNQKTKYGICGILTAILCFPCGLLCLFSDRKKRCARCNIALP
ncbi:hypothetical protein F5879DRAFT_934726 [Lentinula edodes]|nr:hypothetical protein F5879DRAFT_934726 [Lentinula edodes]